MILTFRFDRTESVVHIRETLPSLGEITGGSSRALMVCDTNTVAIARKTAENTPVCVLEAGENAKNWANIEKILCAAKEAGLGRDGVFIGAGGGVVSDMAAFAASVYMRGAKLALVSTTLLGMADAAVGGKTGFDLFSIKNFIGTFYPSPLVFMPLETLETLPEREWKSGMAEIIKTAVLDENEAFLDQLGTLADGFPRILISDPAKKEILLQCIGRAVAIKGRIVESDPKETGDKRVLLNLGHTFGHALETARGLGVLTHGEAVAWGIARACELGQKLGVTTPDRAQKILNALNAFGYEINAPIPFLKKFLDALTSDKKKKNGKFTFIVPDKSGCTPVFLDNSFLEKFLER
jgi:3-dehydroquinate synthase